MVEILSVCLGAGGAEGFQNCRALDMSTEISKSVLDTVLIVLACAVADNIGTSLKPLLSRSMRDKAVHKMLAELPGLQ